ncbi:MAG: NERD domain-containing protein [Ignavibacteriaceae bacterium]|nr:NERD domain-containing protein [Ignavibacteriaceae bacterium]
MLEIRKSSFARNYENSFFREFSQNLSKLFEAKKMEGVLIGSPICEIDERLQIDALLITTNVVCIIDFKNYSGEIILPFADNFEYGKWINNGNQIMGGSTINPFIQLRNQKERFIKLYSNHIKKNLPPNDSFNPYHILRVVCFQKEITVKGSIPSKEKLNFFILGKQNYLESLYDLLDVNDDTVKLSNNSFSVLKEFFKADPYDLNENYQPEIVAKYDSSDIPNYESLYQDQKVALREVEGFISSSDERVFILQGTSLSGKTHLIPFIKDIAYKNDIPEVQLFASSSRIANNLLKNDQTQFNSIYSYIYGGNIQENLGNNEDEENAEVEDENMEKFELEIVPLKKCDNENRALFIVDESQLVSDNYHQSIDLRFGSGKLLKDFLKFTDLKNSNRKIIFIGDNYQLTMGKIEKCPLNPSYIEEEYQLKTRTFQLLDKAEKSPIIKQALSCVHSIRENIYNNFSIELSESLQSINKDDIILKIKEQIEGINCTHILCYSNTEAQKINYWIKEKILINGDDLAKGDLVLINNNFKVEDSSDPFTEPKKIYNGQFGIITEISNDIIREVIQPNGKNPITLTFRKVKMTLTDTSQAVIVLSLENYRLSDRGELSEDEILALRILLNREIQKEISKISWEDSDIYQEFLSTKQYQEINSEIEALKIKLNKGEKVKTKLDEAERKLRRLIKLERKKYRKLIEKKLIKDNTSSYYKYKNAAYLRFGWALTVHKAMSYKWDEIIFNVDQGDNRGKANENYFRWIYTGLTRSKNKAYLINYTPITPFYKTEFRDNSSIQKYTKNIYFIATENNTKLSEFNQFIKSKVESSKLKIKSVNNLSYQEVYHIMGSSGEEAKVSFYYNNKGQFKNPSLITSQPKEFGEEVMNILVSSEGIKNFSFISDSWRRNIYEKLNIELTKNNIAFDYIIQAPYKDTIKLISKIGDIVFDAYYNGDGFFISLITTKYDDVKIWSNLINSINEIS